MSGSIWQKKTSEEQRKMCYIIAIMKWNATASIGIGTNTLTLIASDAWLVILVMHIKKNSYNNQIDIYYQAIVEKSWQNRKQFSHSAFFIKLIVNFLHLMIKIWILSVRNHVGGKLENFFISVSAKLYVLTCSVFRFS